MKTAYQIERADRDGLLNGYDYQNQAWVTDGRYDSCAHPREMHCTCYGRIHAGELVSAENEEHVA
jgi:hypothetical protein